MRIFLKTLLALCLFSAPSWATTWYVRDGGGTSTQCTGTTNAVYPGSGTAQPCALNSPGWLTGYTSSTQPAILGNAHTTALMAQGDTLNIVGDSDTTWDFLVTSTSQITTAPAVGDTYTNNGITWTVTAVNLSGSNNANGYGIISASASVGNSPTASGTLTRTSGSGDSSITFSSSSGSQAQFLIGVGAPNASNFNPATLLPPPAGASSSSLTPVKGIGNHQPQLYGVSQGYVLNLVPQDIPTSGTLTVVNGHGTGTSPITYSGSSQSSVFFPAWVFTVSGITTAPAIGDKYTNDGGTFTVKGMNLIGSPGSISGTIIGLGNFPSTPPLNAPGTLTRSTGSGDATIAYSAYLFANGEFSVSGVSVDPQPGDEYTTGGVVYDVVAVAETAGTGSIAVDPEINLDVENLELTDHTSCGVPQASTNPGWGGYPAHCGGGAFAALSMVGTNVTTKNLWVHGAGQDGVFYFGKLSNWNSTDDRFIGNSAFGDDGGLMQFGGSNTMTRDVWAFNGCEEKYPVPDPTNFKDLNNYVNCQDPGANDSGGIFSGGGFMMQYNYNLAPCGNWTITQSQFLFNMKTNIDFLHCDGTGTFNMYRSRSEGSTGEALKLQVHTVNLEENQLIGDAPVWKTTAFEAIKAPYATGTTTWDYHVCRGDAVTVMSVKDGTTMNYINDDVEGNCGYLVEVANNFNQSCTGMTINMSNSKFIGGYNYGDDNGPVGWATPFTCTGGSTVSYTATDDAVYNVSSGGANFTCLNKGTGMVCGDPKVVGEATYGAVTAWLGNSRTASQYLSTTSLGDQFYLQGTSPLIGAGSISGLSYTNGTTNSYNNTAASSPIDIGAIYNNDCISTSNANGLDLGLCSSNAQCCSSGVCSAVGFCPFTGSIANNQACYSYPSCASGYCCADSCSSGVCGASGGGGGGGTGGADQLLGSLRLKNILFK